MKKTKLNYNIVRYKSNYAVLDIESFNEIQNARPYDISITILNNKHEKLDTYCLLLEDIITKPEFQENCYYKDKLGYYFIEFEKKSNKNIKFVIGNAYKILTTLNDIINKYDIKLIKGYNIGFDYSAINRLYEDVNNSIRLQKKWFNTLNKDYKKMPMLVHTGFKKVNCCDIMYGFTTLLQNNINYRKEYERFCIENNYLSDSGLCISSKEDTMYKFFVDSEHNEWHMGFKDVEDEIELDKVLRQKANTKGLKNACLTLNTKVNSSVYKNYGLYTLKRVKKELEID